MDAPVGKPVVVTVNVVGTPGGKVLWSALVIVGGSFTVTV
jgi:hypothetical protein